MTTRKTDTPSTTTPNGEDPDNPFPVDALPPVIRAFAIAMQRTIKAPMGICVASLLTAMSLAVQSLANIQMPSVPAAKPLSLFLLTIARSGERKSACDSVAMAPIEQYETDQQALYGDDARGLTVADVTMEGVDRELYEGARSLAICNDEGGQVVGSRQANDDGKITFLTGLSKCWDGKDRRSFRAGAGSRWICGKRVGCHLMVQPFLARDLIHDRVWCEQGILARFLVSEPASTMGTRTLARWSKAGKRAQAAFETRVRELLDHPQPTAAHDDNVLRPPAIEMTSGAQTVWADFYHEVEFQLGANGPLESVQPFANKLAEHAARLSGCFAVFEKGPDTKVTQDQMERAIRVARYYLREVVRLQSSADQARRMRPVQQLRDWLAKWADGDVAFAEMLQKGPPALRRKAELEPVVGELVASGELVPIPGGAVRDGKHRRLAYRIVIEHGAAAAE
jgi:hypothetical protein